MQGTGQGMAVVPEVPVMQRDSERSTIFEDSSGFGQGWNLPRILGVLPASPKSSRF